MRQEDEDGETALLLRPQSPASRMAEELDKQQIDGETAGVVAKSVHSQNDLIEDLTLYERKSLLINRELDKMGMGKYQICIWFLCGFGYLLDLLWAEAFGLIATPLYQEFNVATGSAGDIFTAFSTGLTVGAFTWGILVDIIGRRWAFNLTCLVTSVFGLLIAAPKDNYKAICALTALCGFGLGGNIPIDALITLEFIPQKDRWLLPLLSIFQPLGVVICAAIAFGLVPRFRCGESLPACSTVAHGVACCTLKSNIGWRYLMIVLGCLTLTVFLARFFVFDFQESPKFLLAKGRDADAIEVLHRISRFNKGPVPQLTMEDFRALESEYPEEAARRSTETPTGVLRRTLKKLGHLRGLFSTRKLTFTTLILWIVYMGDFWSFNIAGNFLPIILARHGQDASQSVTDTYRQYIYIYLPGILGAALGAVTIQIPGVGRKWSLVLGAGVQGLSMALYTQAKTIKAAVGLNALEYIMQSFFNAVLYGFTPEVFPAPIRGSAAGLCSTMGRLAGIIAPIAAAKELERGSDGVLWLGAGGIFLAMFMLLFLPIETRNKQSY